MQKVKDIAERKTVLLAERNVQPIVSCGSLQFKIERAAEALAKGQSPSLVDARAERCVNDQLHAAAFVEESLGDYRSQRRNCAEDRATGSDIFGGLLGAGLIEPAFRHKPIHSFREIGAIVFLGA